MSELRQLLVLTCEKLGSDRRLISCDDTANCRIFMMPGGSAFSMSRSSGVCTRKALTVCTVAIYYTRPFRARSSATALLVLVEYRTRVFVLTDTLATVRRSVGRMLVLHFTKHTTSLFTVKVNRVGYFSVCFFSLFFGTLPFSKTTPKVHRCADFTLVCTRFTNTNRSRELSPPQNAPALYHTEGCAKTCFRAPFCGLFW